MSYTRAIDPPVHGISQREAERILWRETGKAKPYTTEDFAAADFYPERLADEPAMTANQIAEVGTAADGSLISDAWLIPITVRDKAPEEIEAELQARRQGMTVPRDDFAAAVMVSGIITPQDAEDWASGNALPAAVEAALNAGITDPTQLAIAKIKALSSANIGRTNPLIDMLAATFEITPEEVDTLFETAKQIGEQP